MAWLLATTADEKQFNPKLRRRVFSHGCAWDGYRTPQFLDTLAVAFAANGDFESAAKTEQTAIEHAVGDEKQELQTHLEMFKNKKPLRMTKGM